MTDILNEEIFLIHTVSLFLIFITEFCTNNSKLEKKMYSQGMGILMTVILTFQCMDFANQLQLVSTRTCKLYLLDCL